MRIGVFYTTTASPWGGSYTIKEDLFRGLTDALAGSGHELVAFTDDLAHASRFPSAGVTWVHVRGMSWRAPLAFLKMRINRICAHGLLLPPAFSSESWLDPFVFRAGVDLFVNLGPDAITRAIPYVCTVFDLQHRGQPFMPEVNARGYWERWDAQYREFLGRAAFVINGTRAGRTDIVRLFQVPRDRIVWLPLPTPGFALAAAQEPRRPRPAYLKPGPFLFYPAQFWPHKNQITLLETLAFLRREALPDMQVVLVGSNQGNQAFVLERIAALGLSDVVHVRGFVDRAELIALYQHALAMPCVSTSGPESLPTLEAFALGCPVISADTPGTREQFRGAALLVAATDPAQVAGAVLTLHRDFAQREALVAAGRAVAAGRTPAQFARGLYAALEPFEQIRKTWSRRRPAVTPLGLARTAGR